MQTAAPLIPPRPTLNKLRDAAAECKACDRPTKRSLQKDIEEFANLKGPIANAIRAHYGQGTKLKVIYLFVTDNVVWSAEGAEAVRAALATALDPEFGERARGVVNPYGDGTAAQRIAAVVLADAPPRAKPFVDVRS